MATSALVAQSIPLALAAGFVVSVGLWAIRAPKIAISLLLLTLVVGQLARGVLPGQGGGILPSDIAALLVVVVAVGQLGWGKTLPPVRQRALVAILVITPWVLWSLTGLIVAALKLSSVDAAIAAAYWLRLTIYVYCGPALYLLCAQQSTRRWLHCGLVVTIVVLAALGLLQVSLLPTLLLTRWGFDPHQGRLFSTWLDPNFMGGLLASTLPWLVVVLGRRIGSHARYWWLSLLCLAGVAGALLLTQSRSSLLALGVGLLISSPLYVAWLRKYPQLPRIILTTSASLLVGLLLMVAIILLRERALGLLLGDATVQLRLRSLQVVWQIAASHSWLGVGYNAYQFAAQDAGLIADFSIHSRAGADNSALTLWVTTGIMGVALFLLPWLLCLVVLVRRALARHDVEALTVATGIIIWLVHGQFINSWLYGHLLLVVVSLVAVVLAPPARRYD